MPVEVRRSEGWSNAQAAGGALLAVVPDVLSATDRYELNGRETIRVEIRRESPAWQHLRERRVLRVLLTDDTWREWRITDITESRSASQLAGRVEGEAVKYDMADTLLERLEADGTANPYFELYGLTPTQHLSVIVASASTHFSAGAVGSSEALDMVYDWDSPLSAVHALAYQAGLELSVVGRSTGYTTRFHLPDSHSPGALGPWTTGFPPGVGNRPTSCARSSTSSRLDGSWCSVRWSVPLQVWGRSRFTWCSTRCKSICSVA